MSSVSSVASSEANYVPYNNQVIVGKSRTTLEAIVESYIQLNKKDFQEKGSISMVEDSVWTELRDLVRKWFIEENIFPRPSNTEIWNFILEIAGKAVLLQKQ